MSDFIYEQYLKNLVLFPTCFKSVENPSTIYIFLTNRAKCFQKSIGDPTGLSHFNKMVATSFKMNFSYHAGSFLRFATRRFLSSFLSTYCFLHSSPYNWFVCLFLYVTTWICLSQSLDFLRYSHIYILDIFWWWYCLHSRCQRCIYHLRDRMF